jgi:ABC-type transporter Mla subunit MlaD
MTTVKREIQLAINELNDKLRNVQDRYGEERPAIRDKIAALRLLKQEKRPTRKELAEILGGTNEEAA